VFETEPRPRQKVQYKGKARQKMQDQGKAEAVVSRPRQGKAEMLRGRGKAEAAKKTASRLPRGKALPRGLHHWVKVTLYSVLVS